MRMLRFLLASAFMVAHAHAQSVFIEDLTWTEVRDAIAAGKTTAIVYAGSTEQKGPHMAIGEHNFVAHAVGGRIAEKLGNALVYPILPYAITGDPVARTGHMAFPGSATFSPEVFRGAMKQIALSAIAAGFREIYLMGDHGGGQAEIKQAAESLAARWGPKGVKVRYVPDLYYKTQDQVKRYLADRHIELGDHAGAWDTSELMALDSSHKWIRHDKLAKSDASQQPKTGVDGDPTKSTPDMGRIFIEMKAQAAVDEIQRFRSAKSKGRSP